MLLVFGAAYGGMNVAMNSAAVDLVAELQPARDAELPRGVQPGRHGRRRARRAGRGGLSASTHLFLLAGTGLLVTAFAGPSLLRHRPAPAAQETVDRRAPRQRLSPRARRVVVLFGVIALCTAYGEGALADWGALHLEQDLGAHPGLAAAGYALFALTMTAVAHRDPAPGRLGQTRTLVLGGVTASAGMLLGALAPTAWLALAGFAVTGLGLANIFPVAVGRAGELAGPGGVAAASTLGYGGMLLGPPAIGFLADWFSLPLALTTVALLAAAAAALGYGARNATTDAHT